MVEYPYDFMDISIVIVYKHLVVGDQSQEGQQQATQGLGRAVAGPQRPPQVPLVSGRPRWVRDRKIRHAERESLGIVFI